MDNVTHKTKTLIDMAAEKALATGLVDVSDLTDSTDLIFIPEINLDISEYFVDLIDELRDEISTIFNSPTTKHGTFYGRMCGCTGPMCMKVNRDQGRSRRMKLTLARFGTLPKHRGREKKYIVKDQIIELFQKHYESLFLLSIK